MLGAHVSTAGGLARAPENGRAIAAEAIQVFTRNQVQWKGRPVGKREAASFRSALASSGVRVVLSHGSYLVNLASPDRANLRRSRAAFLAEIIHLNDAQTGLGSRRDRDESIGHGQLGLATFRRLLRDPRLRGVPKVLETPGPLPRWEAELRLLRKLRGRAGG